MHVTYFYLNEQSREVTKKEMAEEKVTEGSNQSELG